MLLSVVISHMSVYHMLHFQQPTLSDMTQYELNFSLLVEQMLSKITDPAYRQMIVEVGSRVFSLKYIEQCNSQQILN